jgi:anti-sigma B factor antagonist
MEIQEHNQGAVTVLVPKGPLVEGDTPAFREHLERVLARTLGRFVLDASGVPFADSKGLETLLDLTEQMGQSGQSLKLCKANETLREVLDLTGLAPHFEFFEDANDAVRSFL